MILATLCYIKRGGSTLMVYRNKKANDIHEGKWNGLGGKFEPGETPEECIIREVYEESGLILYSPKLCGLLMSPISRTAVVLGALAKKKEEPQAA